MFELDSLAFDAADSAQAHDALNRPQRIELTHADDRPAVHLRFDVGIDPQEDFRRLQATREIHAIFGVGRGFHPACLQLHVRPDQPQRLERSSAEEPGVAWPYPLDPVWINARVQQKVAGIHCSLSCANHCEAARRCVEADELVGRHEIDASGD